MRRPYRRIRHRIVYDAACQRHEAAPFRVRYGNNVTPLASPYGSMGVPPPLSCFAASRFQRNLLGMTDYLSPRDSYVPFWDDG